MSAHKVLGSYPHGAWHSAWYMLSKCMLAPLRWTLGVHVGPLLRLKNLPGRDWQVVGKSTIFSSTSPTPCSGPQAECLQISHHGGNYVWRRVRVGPAIASCKAEFHLSVLARRCPLGFPWCRAGPWQVQRWAVATQAPTLQLRPPHSCPAQACL